MQNDDATPIIKGQVQGQQYIDPATAVAAAQKMAQARDPKPQNVGKTTPNVVKQPEEKSKAKSVSKSKKSKAKSKKHNKKKHSSKKIKKKSDKK